MNKSQQVKFESLYAKHVSALKRQGKADKTVEVYARAVRRVAQFSRRGAKVLKGHCLKLYLEALLRRLNARSLRSTCAPFSTRWDTSSLTPPRCTRS